MRDTISLTVDARIFDFLAGTAATAVTLEDLVDLSVGAQAGLARFMWAARAQDVTPETLAEAVRTNFLNLFRQLAEGDGRTVQ